MSDDAVTEAFEEQRPRLIAVAHRMLGDRADAEDAVQEAWLRLSRQEPDSIDNLAGWLTTVVGRVCIDVLRSRRSRAEAFYGDQPPEWIVSADEEPEATALLAESVGIALLVVLDSLSPDERLAFVLHDTFAMPFDEIAPLIGKSTDAAKMLASRARRKVRAARRPADRRRQAEVVEAFLAAARGGDFEGLLKVLDPDVTWHIHSARGSIERIGATALARQASLGATAQVVARRVLVNGEPGIAAWRSTGKPLGVMACTVERDRIVRVDSVTDPDRLEAMGLGPLRSGAGLH
jgi:RNA polymerase sigma factor (sigma-70 family)